MSDVDCVFCDILTRRAPATIVREWPEAIAIVPLRPRVPGHVLVLPRTHVADAGEDPAVTGYTAGRASELLAELDDGNLITSKGGHATQTVRHLHIHVLPRYEGDGLLLPWSDQLAEAPESILVTCVTCGQRMPIRQWRREHECPEADLRVGDRVEFATADGQTRTGSVVGLDPLRIVDEDDEDEFISPESAFVIERRAASTAQRAAKAGGS